MIDTAGNRLLSQKIPNHEPALLDLIANVLKLGGRRNCLGDSLSERCAAQSVGPCPSTQILGQRHPEGSAGEACSRHRAYMSYCRTLSLTF
ncbi:hypothetical protein M1E17_06680 [Arthrobacter sp. D1-29]